MIRYHYPIDYGCCSSLCYSTGLEEEGVILSYPVMVIFVWVDIGVDMGVAVAKVPVVIRYHSLQCVVILYDNGKTFEEVSMAVLLLIYLRHSCCRCMHPQ